MAHEIKGELGKNNNPSKTALRLRTLLQRTKLCSPAKQVCLLQGGFEYTEPCSGVYGANCMVIW